MFQNYCSECNKDTSWNVNNDGYNCCDNCGLVDEHYIHLVSCDTFNEDQEPRPQGYFSYSSITSDLANSKGKYKPIFHWNERIAQLCCADPELPENIIERIWVEVLDGHQGSCENFTRADVMILLKKLKLRKYKERWKRILNMLNPNFRVIYPKNYILERFENIYIAVETRFFEMKNQMPKSVIRKQNGEVRMKDRHSNLPFNYLFRKICEAFGIYNFHDELPLLRSAQKLHNLDDITEPIFKMIGLKFSRSVVVKRPKTKKSRSRKKLK